MASDWRQIGRRLVNGVVSDESGIVYGTAKSNAEIYIFCVPIKGPSRNPSPIECSLFTIHPEAHLRGFLGRFHGPKAKTDVFRELITIYLTSEWPPRWMELDRSEQIKHETVVMEKSLIRLKELQDQRVVKQKEAQKETREFAIGRQTTNGVEISPSVVIYCTLLPNGRLFIFSNSVAGDGSVSRKLWEISLDNIHFEDHLQEYVASLATDNAETSIFRELLTLYVNYDWPPRSEWDNLSRSAQKIYEVNAISECSERMGYELSKRRKGGQGPSKKVLSEENLQALGGPSAHASARSLSAPAQVLSLDEVSDRAKDSSQSKRKGSFILIEDSSSDEGAPTRAPAAEVSSIRMGDSKKLKVSSFTHPAATKTFPKTSIFARENGTGAMRAKSAIRHISSIAKKPDTPQPTDNGGFSNNGSVNMPASKQQRGNPAREGYAANGRNSLEVDGRARFQHIANCFDNLRQTVQHNPSVAPEPEGGKKDERRSEVEAEATGQSTVPPHEIAPALEGSMSGERNAKVDARATGESNASCDHLSSDKYVSPYIGAAGCVPELQVPPRLQAEQSGVNPVTNRSDSMLSASRAAEKDMAVNNKAGAPVMSERQTTSLLQGKQSDHSSINNSSHASATGLQAVGQNSMRNGKAEETVGVSDRIKIQNAGSVPRRADKPDTPAKASPAYSRIIQSSSKDKPAGGEGAVAVEKPTNRAAYVPHPPTSWRSASMATQEQAQYDHHHLRYGAEQSLTMPPLPSMAQTRNSRRVIPSGPALYQEGGRQASAPLAAPEIRSNRGTVAICQGTGGGSPMPLIAPQIQGNRGRQVAQSSLTGVFETHARLIVNGSLFIRRENSALPDAWVYESDDHGPQQTIDDPSGQRYYKRRYVRRDRSDEERFITHRGFRLRYQNQCPEDYFIEFYKNVRIGRQKYWLIESFVPHDIFFGSGNWAKR